MSIGAAATALFLLLVWASDQITLDGERTIYTVNCEGGRWVGQRCEGNLVAGDRYRYRASRSRHEVIFWVAGSSAPYGRYSDCVVQNRGNWSCKPSSGTPPSVTLEMVGDRATHGTVSTTKPFHALPKWKWWLVRGGFGKFHEAAY